MSDILKQCGVLTKGCMFGQVSRIQLIKIPTCENVCEWIYLHTSAETHCNQVLRIWFISWGGSCTRIFYQNRNFSTSSVSLQLWCYMQLNNGKLLSILQPPGAPHSFANWCKTHNLKDFWAVSSTDCCAAFNILASKENSRIERDVFLPLEQKEIPKPLSLFSLVM